MTLTEVFSSIASAINNKGVSGSMKPTEMAEKIASISSGGDENFPEIKITKVTLPVNVSVKVDEEEY